MRAFRAFLVPKLYLGVKKMCKKFCEIPIVGLDLYRNTVLTTPPNRAMDSPMDSPMVHPSQLSLSDLR